MKYQVYAIVTGSKYLGEIEASSKEEAEEKADSLESCYISLCHQCDEEIEDPQITSFMFEEDA